MASNNSNTIGVQSIGKLEAEIFKMVCDSSSGATVRDVYEKIREERRIAYTTVLSVMNNLTTKGILKQDKSSSAFVYKPKVSNVDLANNIIQTVINKLLDGKAEPVISYFQGKGK